jgi:thioredoxin 1
VVSFSSQQQGVSLADELADVKVCKVDIDQAEALATEYGVEVVPTFIVFENGEAVKSVSGVMPKPVILDMLK